jgi:hypothetical protein
LSSRNFPLRKELKYDPASTIHLVRKWGPSARTIIHIKQSDEATNTEADLVYEANAAAQEICEDPSSIFRLSGSLRIAQGQVSSLVFTRPYRVLAQNGHLARSGRAIPFIPTKHLSDIFEKHRIKASNDKSLQLFRIFSLHYFTRTLAGWNHEQMMLACLSSDEPPVRIFRDGEEGEMLRSTRLLSGTVAGINGVGVSDAFYWIPSVANFKGIDCVLGDTNGNIYAVQATVANDYSSPVAGLQQVWKYLHPDARMSRTWHFVVLADCEAVARVLVKQFSKELDDFTLGHTRVRVTVWGCVLYEGDALNI